MAVLAQDVNIIKQLNSFAILTISHKIQITSRSKNIQRKTRKKYSYKALYTMIWFLTFALAK